MVSKAQNRFFRWADAHPQESGVSRKVSEDFINASHGEKIRDLPEHVVKKSGGGSVRMPAKPFRW